MLHSGSESTPMVSARIRCQGSNSQPQSLRVELSSSELSSSDQGEPQTHNPQCLATIWPCDCWTPWHVNVKIETYFDHFLKLSEPNGAIYNPVDEALLLLLQNGTLEKEGDGRLPTRGGQKKEGKKVLLYQTKCCDVMMWAAQTGAQSSSSLLDCASLNFSSQKPLETRALAIIFRNRKSRLEQICFQSSLAVGINGPSTACCPAARCHNSEGCGCTSTRWNRPLAPTGSITG